MNWYYVDGGQQAGPVDDAQLEELLRSGKINPGTLVWREGMANWQLYSEAKGSAQASSAPATTGTPPVAGQSAPEAVCAECGRIFNVNDMIRHGTKYVCAGCKPVFMQKLREGANYNSGTAALGDVRYAGFWIRFAAKFVDGLILGVVLIIPMVVIFGVAGAASARGGGPQPEAMMLLQLLAQLGYYVLAGIYSIFFVGKYGATPGKMACGLKVVTDTGERVSYGRATGRFFAEILSGMICYIGYIMAGFDQQKRSLHDHICSTRVIYK
jgi:uncharacterized RDD family membrane protein YckC